MRQDLKIDAPKIKFLIKKKYKEALAKKKKKGLGEGYYVQSIRPGTNKFFTLNKTPVTLKRARDIGAYYTKSTLARTFKPVKANKPAQPDIEFMYIPEGYFESVVKEFRPYRIKGGEVYNLGKQFIQKSPYMLGTASEKAQIQAYRKREADFQKQIQQMNKGIGF